MNSYRNMGGKYHTTHPRPDNKIKYLSYNKELTRPPIIPTAQFRSPIESHNEKHNH